MAYTCINWAIQQTITATMKFVLVVLANRADEKTFQCFPSLSSICRDTSLGRSTVIRALNELEKQNLIQRVRRGYQSTTYVLLTGGLTVNLVPERDQSQSETGVVPERDGVVPQRDSVVPERDRNHQEPTGTINTNTTRFAEFWHAYPKKVAKAGALRVWNRLKPDDALHQTILQAVRIASGSEEWRKDGGRYIPHPTTWLNQRRWEDEHLQSSVRRNSVERFQAPRPDPHPQYNSASKDERLMAANNAAIERMLKHHREDHREDSQRRSPEFPQSTARRELGMPQEGIIDSHTQLILKGGE
jgi:hypothetical protein